MVCFLILILCLMICVYKTRQVKRQRPEQVPANTQEPFQEIDLANFDIENFDSLEPWEQNAHIWINQHILSIKNENYEG